MEKNWLKGTCYEKKEKLLWQICWLSNSYRSQRFWLLGSTCYFLFGKPGEEESLCQVLIYNQCLKSLKSIILHHCSGCQSSWPKQFFFSDQITCLDLKQTLQDVAKHKNSKVAWGFLKVPIFFKVLQAVERCTHFKAPPLFLKAQFNVNQQEIHSIDKSPVFYFKARSLYLMAK